MALLCNQAVVYEAGSSDASARGSSLSLSIEALKDEIESQERLMESYKEQDNYGKMCGQYHYLDGLHRALLLVRGVYAANDIETQYNKELSQ